MERLPLKPGASFECHLFSAIAGIVAAFGLRRRDPLPRRRVCDWETDDPENQEQNYLIGGIWRETKEADVQDPGRRDGE